MAHSSGRCFELRFALRILLGQQGKRTTAPSLLTRRTGEILAERARDFYQSKTNNFGPRFGMTWSPKFLGGKTVFRGGGGLYYGPGQYEDLIQPIESNVFRSSTTLAGGLTTDNRRRRFRISAARRSRFTPRAYDTNGYKVPERVFAIRIFRSAGIAGQYGFNRRLRRQSRRNLFLRSITNRFCPDKPSFKTARLCPQASASLIGAASRRSTALCPGQIVGVTTIREFDVLGRRFDAAIGNNRQRPAGSSSAVRRNRLQNERRQRPLRRAANSAQPSFRAGLDAQRAVSVRQIIRQHARLERSADGAKSV